MPSLGIDFETTKCIAGYWDEASKSPKAVLLGRGRAFMPTTIPVDARGQFSFGDEADDQRATDARG